MIGTPKVTHDGDGLTAGQPPAASAVASMGDRWLGWGQAAVLRILSSTWRVECEGLEILDALERAQERHMLAFWHRNYVTLFRLFHDRPTVAITNASHRGQIIAQICQHSGMRSLQVRGRGSKQMLAALDDVAASGLGLSIAVDGPLGPPRNVKQVVLHLAARLNCQIVPVSVATGSKFVFKRRWDQLEIPYLFSRVVFVVGSPLLMPPATTKAGLRQMGTDLKEKLDRGELLARQRLLSRRPVKSV